MARTVEIVIPVLNEAMTISSQVTKLMDFLNSHQNLAFDYLITIADNGSTDASLEIAQSLNAKFSRVKVISLPERGVGRALKRAWAESQSEFVGYMDLDFATDLGHLWDVESAFVEKFDCVFGSRLLGESEVIGRSLKRDLTSRAFNFIVRRALNTDITDGMCGFKFVRRDLVSRLYEQGAECDGWFFCTEIAVSARMAGLRILEIPVKWQDDAQSKVKIPSLAYEYLGDIARFRRRVKLLPNRLN